MENKKLKDLTTSQELVLESLKKFIAEHGFSPTVRELCEINNFKSSATVQTHLSSLQEKGYIKKSNSKSRTLELLVPNSYEKDNKIIKVPLYEIGLKNNLESPTENYIEILNNSYNEKKVFALKVKGNNLVNFGIYDNDILIVERSSKVLNNSLIVGLDEDNNIVICKESKLTKVFGKVTELYRSF